MMFSSAIELNEKAIQGMVGVLLGAFLHSLSAVCIKRIDGKLPAMTQVAGGLLIAMPLYLCSWFYLDQAQWPAVLPMRSLLAIVYLGIVATTLGFALYYYVLTHLSATNVAMITIISPVLALMLGHFVNGETLTIKVAVGTSMILAALIAHQFIERRQKIRLRHQQEGA
nr:DMT family transporter [Methylomarinum sp. Ch1-1]MDP4519971.1 DMT family transporter [Methylomarinum sp. Ch1-1]